MSDNKEFFNYPRAKIAVEGGELQDAENVQVALTNGRALIHTHRGNGQPSGSASGKKSVKVTWKSKIPKAGFERDYFKNWDEGRSVQTRVKLPGKVITVTGCLCDLSITSELEGAVEFTCATEGKYSFSK